MATAMQDALGPKQVRWTIGHRQNRLQTHMHFLCFCHRAHCLKLFRIPVHHAVFWVQLVCTLPSLRVVICVDIPYCVWQDAAALEPACTLAEGLATQYVLDAARESSAKGGGWVTPKRVPMA